MGWDRAHVMCSGGLVSKPQGEAGTKPAHIVHFLYSRVIGLELMSGALEAWCGNHEVNRAQNQLTMHIFFIPLSLARSSCQVLWGPGVETAR